MKILHVIGSLDLSLGGPPRSTVGLCQALAHAGHDVTILTTSARGWESAELGNETKFQGTLSIELNSAISRTGRESARSCDIVHMQSIWSLANVRLGEYCAAQRIPYVLSPRGELDEWSMRQKYIKKRIFLSVFGRRLIRQAAALHLLNKEERDGLRRLHLQGHTFVVPNGIEPAEWPYDYTELQADSEQTAQTGRQIILFLARLHHKKGPVLLAKAFAQISSTFPDAELLICGPDYGELAKVRAIPENCGLTQRVRCLGMIDGDERTRLLREADIFVLPSFQEGHPRTVLEAAIMGKAMVITAECHCPEFIDGKSAIVVEPAVDSVARGLRRLLADRKLQLTIGRAARSVVLENYTWQRIADRMIRYYHRCLSSPNALSAL